MRRKKSPGVGDAEARRSGLTVSGSPSTKLSIDTTPPPQKGKFGAKLVLFFESGRKLSLNGTSVGNLIRDIGQDYDDWTAHDVKVFAGEVDFKHGKADAVLVELIDTDTPPPTSSKTPPEPPKKPTSKAAAGNDMDDEIPF